jgi:hypothetical protein
VIRQLLQLVAAGGNLDGSGGEQFGETRAHGRTPAQPGARRREIT